MLRITTNDISMGQVLPWPVFDADRVLLVQQGTVMSSQRHVDLILEKGFYRGMTPEEVIADEKKNQEQQRPKVENPFEMEPDCAARLQQLLDGLSSGAELDVAATVQYISEHIRASCEQNTNATLAAVRLSSGFTYSVLHPLHTAILCELLMQRLDFSPAQQDEVIAAALTMNVGMYKLQQTLFVQEESLNEEQKRLVRAHPQISIEILRRAGVTDTAWLRIVLEHHERVDGKGYPRGLSADDIHPGAKLLATADTFAAMVTPSAFRKASLVQNALREVFIHRGETVDEKLAQVLISEVGIYSPGSFVQLANGETGIVVRRAFTVDSKKVEPQVGALISPRGGYYDKVVMRDTAEDNYKIIGVRDPD